MELLNPANLNYWQQILKNKYDINELNNNLVNVNNDVNNKIGDLRKLETTAKDNLVNAINEIKNSSDTNQHVENSIYSKVGLQYGASCGYLRRGNIPKKVVVLGNSMTLHVRNDSIGYTVDDLREMAASKPNNGWISIVQQELKKINPDIKVYKANCATWETTTNGSRRYSNLSGNAVAEVTDERSVETSYTVNDILGNDVDILIVQVYENCPTPSTDDANVLLNNDYINLYNSLKEKCPNAMIYQFCGFWQVFKKQTALITAMKTCGILPIYAPYCGDSTLREDYECKSGDKLYDGNGNQIATVSSSVAGHPNDFGFAVMAMHTLYCLYNEVGLFGNKKCLSISKLDTETQEEMLNSIPCLTSDIYKKGYTGTIDATTLQFNDNLLVEGEYSTTAKVGSDIFHGIFRIKLSTALTNCYIPCIQEIESCNSTTKRRRTVTLSGNVTAFNSWTS